MKTRELREIFELYWMNFDRDNVLLDDIPLSKFEQLPKAMKWGVYQTFYAEHHIFISVSPPEPFKNKKASAGVVAPINPLDLSKRERGMSFTALDSLEEAWEKALEGAENLFNELRLKK